MPDSLVADPGLADGGRARIAWAEGQMPVAALDPRARSRRRPLDGLRVAACLHVTAETGVLVRALQAGGAEVGLCAANPLSTQDDIAAALADDGDARAGPARSERRTTRVGARRAGDPQITLDDGADLLIALHSGSRRPPRRSARPRRPRRA